MYFSDNWHKYSPCEWAWLIGFSRSEVKGQGQGHTSTNVLTL